MEELAKYETAKSVYEEFLAGAGSIIFKVWLNNKIKGLKDNEREDHDKA